MVRASVMLVIPGDVNSCLVKSGLNLPLTSDDWILKVLLNVRISINDLLEFIINRKTVRWAAQDKEGDNKSKTCHLANNQSFTNSITL